MMTISILFFNTVLKDNFTQCLKERED